MRTITILVFLITTLTITSCREQTSRTGVPIVYAEGNDPELEKARIEALESLDYFIQSFRKNSNDTIFQYSVKMDFIDNGEHEHMWIMVSKFENGIFSGYLGSEPQIVKNVKVGQYVNVEKELIEDWLIMDTKTGNWEGGYSIKILLNRKN